MASGNSIRPYKNFDELQYNALRSEMVARMQEHHKLWVFRLIATGSILVFGITTKTNNFDGATLIAPIFVAIFDFLIVNNLVIITKIGDFLSKSRNSPSTWETYIRQEGMFHNKKAKWMADWIALNLSAFIILVIAGLVAFPIGLHNLLEITIAISSLLLFFGGLIWSWKRLRSK